MNYRYILVGLITVVFIVLILMNVSISNIADSIRTIGVTTLVTCLLIHLSVYVLRSLTMYVFLINEVSVLNIIAAHLVHNFYLMIIPASLGELSLPLLLKKDVCQSRTISVLIITRIFMIIIMIMLFATSLIIIFGDLSMLAVDWKRALLMMLIVIILMGALLYALLCGKGRDSRLFRFVILKVGTVYKSIKSIIRNELSCKKVLLLLLITLLYMTMLAIFYRAILIQLSYELSIIELYFIMSIQVAIQLLPIRSFGGFGVTEGSWLIGMLTLGYDRVGSLESGVIVHLIALFSATIFFIIGLLITKILRSKQTTT